jgi:hypothetical protein
MVIEVMPNSDYFLLREAESEWIRNRRIELHAP